MVELSPEQFAALDKASGRVAPADFLRLVALSVIGEPKGRAYAYATDRG